MTNINQHSTKVLRPFDLTIRERVTAMSLATLCVAVLFWANPVLADETTAQTALSRADAKIEMATRQAGLAGDTGDQSFTVAREKRDAAQAAMKAGQYDAAEMGADEAGLLAELTGERAKLAALQTSYDAVAKAASVPITHP